MATVRIPGFKRAFFIFRRPPWIHRVSTLLISSHLGSSQLAGARGRFLPFRATEMVCCRRTDSRRGRPEVAIPIPPGLSLSPCPLSRCPLANRQRLEVWIGAPEGSGHRQDQQGEASRNVARTG